MRKLATYAAGFAIASCLSLRADAQSNASQHIPLDGYAADDQGVALDGPHAVDIKLFRVATGGTALFGEQQKAVSFDQGSFSVLIGKTNPLDLRELSAATPLLLELAIDGDVIHPRFEVGSVPYAGFSLASGDAQTLTGKVPADFAPAAHGHAWTDISGVPSALADGDDADTLAKLTCQSNERPQKVAGTWDCTALSAAELTSGTLSPTLFSAYADLEDEGRLNGSTATDLLTRGAADARYQLVLPSNTAFSITAGSNQTQNTTMSPFQFCALTQTQLSGGGSCTVTPGATGSFTLTATAANNQSTTCKALCF
jgi:hypothetical protein